MPPFRLELPDKRPTDKLPVKIFYTKGVYNPTVKITDWNTRSESLPIDKDPYCPGALNYFLSHYNHLGTEPNEVPLTTTTQRMLQQICTKDDVPFGNPKKYLINYFTYKENLACENDRPIKTCPSVCAEEYLSTMQYSYCQPYPYIMKRFGLPTTPFLQNRKWRWESPDTSQDKFYDEGAKDEVLNLQKVKGSRSLSYNPLTGLNSYGSQITEIKQRCYRLDF